MLFKPHSKKQEDALFSDKRITLCSTGIQWGKTTVGATKLKMLVHQNPGPNCNYIVTAPNFKIMQQACLPELLKVMHGCGEYKKADAVFEVSSGAKIFCRTATDPDSIVGITNVYGIWGDEAGKYPYYFWVNIQGRSRFKQCPIILTTSLYSFNWVCKELIRETERGLRDDVHLCQAESRENPFFPKEEYEKAKASMSPARFAMMYGGRPNKMEGLVYDNFEEKIHIVEPFELPTGTRVYGGIDWGFSQPFALTVGAKLPNGSIMIVSEYVATRLTIAEIIDILKEKQRIWDIERFYAGPDQPGSIKALNQAKLPCSPAENNVRDGVDLVYTLLESGKGLRFFAGQCPNLMDEMENYHWPEPKDLKADDDAKDPNPVKQDDHGLDSLRYLAVSIGKKKLHGFKTKVPTHEKPENESIEQKLKRLKSRKRKTFESW